MKRVNQIVWCADDGHTQLLVEREPGKYYVPLSAIDLQGLCDLGLAVASALQAADPDPSTRAALADLGRALQRVIPPQPQPQP